MTNALGVDLGTTFTAAAWHDGNDIVMLDLAGNVKEMPSVVFLAEDNTFLVGEPAVRKATTDPGRAARQFKRRFGDTTPILLGGTPMSADALTAQLLKAVLAIAEERHGAAPDAVAITHPANWGGYKLELLEQAIRRSGLDEAIVLTEPEAAVLHYAQQKRVPDDALIAVFDLGGGTFDAAVVRKTSQGTEFLGRPEGIERLGGIDFDESIYAFVNESLDYALEDLDIDDPFTRSSLERLRQECVSAKEALSGDEVAEIPVMLPELQTSVRITRDEFESLIRPNVSQAIEALRRALRSGDVDADDLHAVLLAGGSSRIPLMAEMLTNELGRPVAVDAHPKHGVAMGAAMAAAEGLVTSETDQGPAAEPATAPAAEPTPTPVAAPPEPAPVAAPAASPPPPAAPPPEPAPTRAEPVVPTPLPADPTPTSPVAPVPAATSRSKLPIIVAAVVVALAAIGGGVVLTSGGDDGPPKPIGVDPAAVTTTETTSEG